MNLSAWLWLVAAGLVEVAFSQSIRPTAHFTRPLPTLVCFTLGATSIYLLSRAMDAVPVGPAYVVFTGIGSLGAIVMGILVSGDSVTLTRLLGLGLIVSGICVTHLTTATP
jgi:quaternary ammonium compound-resistance protein SugE